MEGRRASDACAGGIRPGGAGPPRRAQPPWHRPAALLVLVLCVAAAAAIRIRFPLADPGFLTDSPAGVMKSDPGLLFYFLERIVAAGGRVPADFRADPRVEYPSRVDLFALDTVSQEFPISWAYLLLRPSLPLHVFALIAMALCAAFTVVGVFFLARELTGRWAGAAAAAALFTLVPANYRTIGLVLMREDASLPLFALHLSLLARAHRLRTPAAVLLCAAPLALALASWHAMGFIVGLEMLCILLWFLRSGENPFALPAAWLAPALVAAFSLAVPALRSTGFLLSLPMQVTAGLLAAALVRTDARARRSVGSAVSLAGFAAALLARRWIFGASGDDYAHVWQLAAAKIAHLGRMPADPAAVPFEVRMMWQGPFRTAGLADYWRHFGGALLLCVPLAVAGLRDWIRRDRPAHGLLLAFTAAALAGVWMVDRFMVVAGAALPVAAAVLLFRFPRRRAGALIAALLLAAQAWAMAGFLGNYRNKWYQPAFQIREYRALLRVLPSLVPPGEAVAADPLLSPAILATTGHPILMQPKWERSASRVPFRDFLTTFYRGSPEDLRQLLLGKYRCRYVLFDCYTLEHLRYIGGLPLTAERPLPGTAAGVFLRHSGGALTSVPGFRLLYRSPPSLLTEEGAPSDLMRLYRLSD